MALQARSDEILVVVCIKANLASNQTVPLSFLNSTATIAHLSTFKHISLLC